VRSRNTGLSSGIGAGLNGDALISPYAADVLAKHGLDSYAAARWQRTTAALAHASDVLVFMESEHCHFCENWVESARQRVEVWEIEDVGPVHAAEIANEVERTFGIIRQRTDAMLTALGPKRCRSYIPKYRQRDHAAVPLRTPLRTA